MIPYSPVQRYPLSRRNRYGMPCGMAANAAGAAIDGAEK
jgi:hypothetical protein